MHRPAGAAGAWFLWGVTLVLIAAAAWLRVRNGSVFILFELSLFASATLGALISWRRPRNPIGWVFIGAALFAACSALAESYAIYAMFTAPGSFPRGDIAAWLYSWSFAPSFASVGLLLVLFPDGKTPSRRWRPLPYLILAGVAVLSFSGALAPGPFFDEFESVMNPFGVESARTLLEIVGGIGWATWILGTVAAALSVVFRYRRAQREQREQLKWVMSAGALVAIGFIGNGFSNEGGDLQWLFSVSNAITATGFIAIPVSCAIAIFKYRLYSIDYIINKAILFTLMSGFIGAVYVVIVVGARFVVFGGEEATTIPSLAATLVVAVAFQPVRERARRFANRRVYGYRSTPYEALANFAAGTAYSADDAMQSLGQVIAEGTGAVRVAVWLRVESGLRTVTVWPLSDEPAELADFGHVVQVEHQRANLGAIGVLKGKGDALTQTEEHLIKGLASQAGQVLRNMRLTAELDARLKEVTMQAQELRASRERIVGARDSERRRLERDIHDGAQQNLVALAVKISLVKNLSGRDVAKAKAILAEVAQEISRALETLRNLSHGIYPPVLTRQGLRAALESEAIAASVPVTIEEHGLGRLSQEIEAAAYFCCLEALQNITKYAEASAVRIKLEQDGDCLVFFVIDDGIGFDPAAPSAGTGLQNMRDRVMALGGDVFVASSKEEGTTVRGRIPLRILAPTA